MNRKKIFRKWKKSPKRANSYYKNSNLLFKNCISMLLCVLEIFLAGCSADAGPDNMPDTPDETIGGTTSESGFILQEKEKKNDGIHLTNEAKDYRDLEKEIDELIKGLPDME